MIAPSSRGGKTTEQVGFFRLSAETLASWLSDGFANSRVNTRPLWSGLPSMLVALAPSPVVSRYACLPMAGGWTALFNNSPLGTDVGVLPSLAARELGVCAVRAVSRDDLYPARILEVFGPDGSPPLLLRPSIVAAYDGGRWVFETFGAPFEFEDDSTYRLRRKADRFPAESLIQYLNAIGIPIESEPIWPEAVVVEISE